MTQTRKTANLNIRIEPDVKDRAADIFSAFGITVADAVKIFLHKSIMAGGLPFDMTVQPRYNAETEAAMREARDIMAGRVKSRAYKSLQEMLDEPDDESEGD